VHADIWILHTLTNHKKEEIMIASDTNYFASKVAREMESIMRSKQKHMSKLSSGKRVEKSTDDAGALGAKLKQASAIRRMRGVNQNLQNALSYTQMQESALKTVDKIYGRMAQLATMALDVTKSDSDRENYDKEFQELRQQVLEIDLQEFNGNALFRNTKYGIIITPTRLSWLDSQQHAADASVSDSEYTHYMATITSQEEQDEIDRQLQGAGTGIALWLGGSDANTEGDWRWVEGPEGDENGGLGRQFWQGQGVGSGGSAINGSYENWNDPNEPNDSGSSEDALQILSTDGEWNDLRNSVPGTPTGYLRESDPNNLKVNDAADGGEFELQKISFKRFLESTTIDLTTMANSKDALERVMEAQEDVIDKIALAGSNSARLTSEINALDVDFVHRETSLGRIEDVDMALTASRLAKAEIKMQAAASIFAQANALFSQRNYVDELL
jgi:flagellin-like hook-associated protein FlgL